MKTLTGYIEGLSGLDLVHDFWVTCQARVEHPWIDPPTAPGEFAWEDIAPGSYN
jgi:hypothetical protein